MSFLLDLEHSIAQTRFLDFLINYIITQNVSNYFFVKLVYFPFFNSNIVIGRSQSLVVGFYSFELHLLLFIQCLNFAWFLVPCFHQCVK